ncbi:hypothetical protein F5888DRAFT_1640095 [Russula emetica]|nr:hypothetical protein F5888DRAFT_1640095 [Russula emetica]
MPSRHPRPDSPLPPSTGNSADVKSASPGSATRFGWQFPRNRPQLPDFEPDTSLPERSPSHVHRSTSQAKRRCTKGHKCATTEFSEANGAVPPKIHLHEPEFASESESMDATSLQGSDDSIQDMHIQDVPTPIARPIEIPPPEKLQSFSPIRTASAAEDPDSDACPSLSTSKIEFETPPPPKGLSELPGPLLLQVPPPFVLPSWTGLRARWPPTRMTLYLYRSPIICSLNVRPARHPMCDTDMGQPVTRPLHRCYGVPGTLFCIQDGTCSPVDA